MTKSPFAVCWGAGWDSTAMIIEMRRRQMPIAIITFADTGSEKNVPDPERGEEIGTYDFIPVFSDWCEENGAPRPVVCHYDPKDETSRRYRQGVVGVAARLGIALSEARLTQLSRLYGNMVANDTLPGIAFGPKSCSIKWKLEAQEPI